MQELQLHDSAAYVTLTYSDDNLPPDGSLLKSDLQKFFKRLRKHYGKVRHYSCGEYGERYGRPHYHSIIYGLRIPDKKYYKHHNGNPLYKSTWLEEIWQKGQVTIGAVSFESCAYVARYIMKKVNGKNQYFHYADVDKSTGEVLSERIPEFTTMSRKPGIGADWYEKYQGDIYNSAHEGVCYVRGGIATKPARYYDEKQFLQNPDKMNRIKERRKEKASVKAKTMTPQILNSIKSHMEGQIGMLPRNQH